ncbi:hypothetical protein E2C01_029669 [Portunus trituberculatus]|uniref:Uncharacterized protein n=1 Tax=Portunus trituberculatus TaxID=210409 RepID=A0A5B7ENJ6_PORTR|nr:hypothetical protein [Portunus trituberculatus]
MKRGVKNTAVFRRGKEDMRFNRGKVVFYRLKVRSNTSNVAEVNEEKVKGGIMTLWVVTEKVRPADISGPLSRRTPRLGSESSFLILSEGCVCSKCL